MITIQQRQFEGRDGGALGSTKKDQGENMNASKSAMDVSMSQIKPIAKSQIGTFSKEVEKIF